MTTSVVYIIGIVYDSVPVRALVRESDSRKPIACGVLILPVWAESLHEVFTT